MARHTDALAKLYARSLYELADSAGGQEKVSEVGAELEQICELVRDDDQFREFFASPLIDEDRRAESLRRIFANRITDLTLRFLLVLNSKGRLGHLETINTAFDQILQEAFGRVEVDVFHAQPVESSDLEPLKEKIGQALGKEPVLHPYHDPKMIGGLKLRIGDQLIDGSISNRLRKLRERLASAGSAAVRQKPERFFEGDVLPE